MIWLSCTRVYRDGTGMCGKMKERMIALLCERYDRRPECKEVGHTIGKSREANGFAITFKKNKKRMRHVPILMVGGACKVHQ